MGRLSPCGESGLKSHQQRGRSRYAESLPMRGEWIEIGTALTYEEAAASLPMRGEWIEMKLSPACWPGWRGLSPCGESGLKSSAQRRGTEVPAVSPHAGRVD